ncbi:glutamate synthase [candidate division KSB1 bacterium]|nr:glutamate synthase [candidate division KSB1 bacterium]
MAELRGLDLSTHLKMIVNEFKANKSIYSYPEKKFYTGFPGYDLSVDFHHKKAATPLGPASGPHTQLAQNIVLSYLHGARIIELKTIQILDELDIPRPCIDARNVGYNVEWSQELRLEESYQEYVVAWMLIKFLEEMELLGVPKGDPFYDMVFDVSAGYDLKGIQSPRVDKWLRDIRDAREKIAELQAGLPEEFERFKNLEIDPHIGTTLTLSTFHGCPRDEIESIVQHLMREHGFHVIVKMNPTLLGYDFVRKTLNDDLGYENVQLDPEAFKHDLQFDEAVAMMRRLLAFGAQHGCKLGAKFTNTLVVKNTEKVFTDEVQYLSGPPLHVLSIHSMHRFRQAMGEDFHISFSAGIAKHNFADTVSCNMKPVTVCTDLLKTGGYSRLFDYLARLQSAMEEKKCTTLKDFVGSEAEAVHRTEAIVKNLISNPVYHFDKNKKAPRKVGSHLELFDCLSCDKCLTVCPNAANFSFAVEPQEIELFDYRFEEGRFKPKPNGMLKIEKATQIANLADFCNECGDCDTYCPEDGGPFVMKPRFFFSMKSYEHSKRNNGFYFVSEDEMIGKIGEQEYRISFDKKSGQYLIQTGKSTAIFDEKMELVESKNFNKLDVLDFQRLKLIFDVMRKNKHKFGVNLLL